MSTLRLIGILCVLAGFDAAATVCVKQAAVQRNPLYMIAAVLLFTAVAGVLYLCVEQADLTLVSIGWIVLFQLVISVVDYHVYGTRLTWIQLTAITVAVLALAVAALAPGPASSAPAIPRPRVPSYDEEQDGPWTPSTPLSALIKSTR